ncbi:MAG TPA: PIN domain-containing protein [Chitinophagales bacterium]|nr:PIN domain-containing protein [Chitinophagales bacterium]HNM31681.1 PIN domain-containing protein [Chitinophagales bacterium]
MRIIIDTNIVFSAILNTNNKIARIIFQPKTGFNFYATPKLLEEVEEHKTKILSLTKLSNTELDRIISLISNKIRFINYNLIPIEIYNFAEKLTYDVDIDDTEFIALTEHIKGKLWTGDKELKKGLQLKNWNKFISTDELAIKLN